MNENPAYKSGFATLIGRPNVGKSTLMNRLIGQKIAITSNKPQTTRNRIQTVLTLEEGQIVFLDTPGIHKAKNKLGDYMVKQVTDSVGDVDCAALPQTFPLLYKAPVHRFLPRNRKALPARFRLG